jgi:hypothetical protein
MVIVPLFCYLASELQMREQTQEAKALTGDEKRKPTRRPLIIVGAALAFIAIVIGNAIAFQVRIAVGDDNALKATAIWAHNNLPANAIVITEESVGAVISQPYCKLAHSGACHHATYMITYNSHTQQPPRDHTTNELLATARKLKTFRGFKEDITILELAKPVK